MRRRKLLTANKLVIVVSILFLALIVLHLWRESSFRWFKGSSINDPFTTDFSGPYSATDSMPYWRFEKIQDSLQEVKRRQQILNEGQGTGTIAAFIGIRKISECDTCKTFIKEFEKDKYYLELPGYFLRDRDFSEFIFKKGDYFIKYPVWDKVSSDYRSGHYVMKKIPFRFSTDQNLETGSVFIPVSKKAHQLLSPVITIFLWLMAIVFLYVLFALPAKVLIRIASGNVFIKKNIRNLKTTAWVLLLVPFAIVLLEFILYLFFRGYISNDAQLAWLYTFYRNGRYFIYGIVIYIIALAFQRGYNLQQEQDLTI